MTRHFGFTGTQEKLSDKQAETLRAVLGEVLHDGYAWMHNGCCIGADEFAGSLWLDMGGAIHLHPPTNQSKMTRVLDWNFADGITPPKDYRARNQDIVNAGELLVATPRTMEEELRSGTWMTIRMARRQGKRIIIIWPDGSIRHE